MSLKALLWIVAGVVVLFQFWTIVGEQATTHTAPAGRTPAVICAETRYKVQKGLAYGMEPRWTQTMIIEQCERDGL